MPIHVLDAETIGRIAAGEVVERPASIAKELIENSLDAGANSITVEIKDGGCSYLRVTDNGCGIPAEEVRLAFENHATSKLSSGDELSDILTLGFRGEALPSIAAVSRITMTTRRRSKDSGIKVSVEGGSVQDVCDAGCPEGTSIVVKDLFFNAPVRRTFLKKTATEAGVVSDMVARLILGNPQVSIRLISNGKTIYRSFGDGDIRHAALAVYGRETAEKLRFMDETEGSVRISGLIGVGEFGKANRSHQFFFINGRVVRSQLMTQALESATRTLVTIGQHPMCALSLKMPPHSVDVNVHPSKLEVRFRDESSVRIYAESMISRALLVGKMLEPEKVSADPIQISERAQIRVQMPSQAVESKGEEVVEEYAKTVKMDADVLLRVCNNERKSGTADVEQADNEQVVPKETPVVENAENKKCLSSESIASKVMMSQPERRIIQDVHSSNLSLKSPSASVNINRSAIRQDLSSPFLYKAISEEHSLQQTDIFSQRNDKVTVIEPIRRIEILGIFASTYILVEYNDTLIMIDQHAAHERILYQEYEKALHQKTAMQQLLTPIILSLSQRERSAILSNEELLLEAGYEIEAFGDRDIQVRAVPYVLGQAELRPLFLEMIDRLDQLKNATIERRRAEVIQMSCKRAVKAGDRLSDAEIQALVDEMLKTDAPPTCPHGRPVLKAFRKSEIEKMFKRI